MIENQIHSRIEGVTDRVFPNQAPENAELPFLLYSVQDSEPQRTLKGSGSLTKHTVGIEAWADNLNTVNSLLANVRTQLDGYQGGNIHRAFCTDPGQGEEEEDGFHKSATYTVWTVNANITPTTDATAIIRTGNEYIEFEACEHVLRLDCDGLSLDGDEVGGSPYPNPSIGTSFLKADVQFGPEGLETSYSWDGAVAKTDQFTVFVDTVQAAAFVGDGSQLTNLPSPDLSDYARTDQPNTFTEDQTVNGEVAATSFSGNGSGLTSLNATELSSGTVADARLSSNVPLKNAANTFTQTQTISTTTAITIPTTGTTAYTGMQFTQLSGGGSLLFQGLKSGLHGTLTLGCVDALNTNGAYVAVSSGPTPLVTVSSALTVGAALTVSTGGAAITGGVTSTGTVIARQSGGTAGTDEVQISHDGTKGTIESKDGQLVLKCNGGSGLPSASQIVDVQGAANYGGIGAHAGSSQGTAMSINGFYAGSAAQVMWSDSNPLGGTRDTGLARESAGVVKVTNASSGNGTITGGFRPLSMADSAAANNTIYYSTTAGKLVYKDGSGVVNNLY